MHCKITKLSQERKMSLLLFYRTDPHKRSSTLLTQDILSHQNFFLSQSLPQRSVQTLAIFSIQLQQKNKSLLFNLIHCRSIPVLLFYEIQKFLFNYSGMIFKQQAVMDEARGIIRTIATAQDPSLVRCFRGHQKTVNAVDFSNDMKQVVSGGADGLVLVWSFKPQIRPFKFIGHKGPVNDVLFNSDSTRVYSCGQDRQIRIWKNTVNGKNKSIKAHSGTILKLSLSKQEDFLVSCSSDKTIKMWTPDGKFKQSFIGHTNWVRQCSISPDQRMLLSCSDDKSLKLWDIQKATASVNFSEHKASVLSCKFTPDGTCVAGASLDGTIKVWDTRLSKLIQHYNAHDSAINQISFHPLGCHMASVSNDNKIKIWNLKKGTLDWTLYGHTGQIKCLDFSQKGDYFATGGSDKLAMIWMTNFDKQMHEKGRRIQSNFRQKSNGEGVQPLFKSNILNYGATKQQNYQQYNSEKQSMKTNGGFVPDNSRQVGQSKKSTKIAEFMSFELEKMVNQLEFITKSLDTMDMHLTEHEQIIDKLENSQTIDDVMVEMENRNLLVPTIYNSAWQAERNIQQKAQKIQRQIQNQDEEDQDQYYQNFLEEEQRKKDMFKRQLEDDQALQFEAQDLRKGFQ